MLSLLFFCTNFGFEANSESTAREYAQIHDHIHDRSVYACRECERVKELAHWTKRHSVNRTEPGFAFGKIEYYLFIRRRRRRVFPRKCYVGNRAPSSSPSSLIVVCVSTPAIFFAIGLFLWKLSSTVFIPNVVYLLNASEYREGERYILCAVYACIWFAHVFTALTLSLSLALCVYAFGIPCGFQRKCLFQLGFTHIRIRISLVAIAILMRCSTRWFTCMCQRSLLRSAFSSIVYNFSHFYLILFISFFFLYTYFFCWQRMVFDCVRCWINA